MPTAEDAPPRTGRASLGAAPVSHGGRPGDESNGGESTPHPLSLRHAPRGLRGRWGSDPGSTQAVELRLNFTRVGRVGST